jgi:hypothetical protein
MGRETHRADASNGCALVRLYAHEATLAGAVVRAKERALMRLHTRRAAR